MSMFKSPAVCLIAFLGFVALAVLLTSLYNDYTEPETDKPVMIYGYETYPEMNQVKVVFSYEGKVEQPQIQKMQDAVNSVRGNMLYRVSENGSVNVQNGKLGGTTISFHHTGKLDVRKNVFLIAVALRDEFFPGSQIVEVE